MKISTRTLILALIMIGVLAVGPIAQWNKGRDEANTDGRGVDQPHDDQVPDEATGEQPPTSSSSRESLIPDDVVKMTPGMDANPPKSYSPEYGDPVPIPGLVNTAGAHAFAPSWKSMKSYFYMGGTNILEFYLNIFCISLFLNDFIFSRIFNQPQASRFSIPTFRGGLNFIFTRV